ncbi:MAG TPA: hypothetical protein VNK96_10025 [Fimbriimonadales bacterium]|nr:hypothetical protein [Fimbriimonadales bacterium]
MAGCRKGEEQRDTSLRQPPITEKGLEVVCARVQKAASLVLRYADKHGGQLPKAETSLELRDILKKEFGNTEGFDELWVSHNGKALLVYSQNVAGKNLKDFSDATKKRTVLLWDPVQLKPHGIVTAFLSGEVKAVPPKKPQAAGTAQI